MRPGKRHSLYTLLAVLVRHQPIETALRTAATQLGFNPGGLSNVRPPGDVSPGEELALELAGTPTPAEKAVIRGASTREELAARLAELVEVVETERSGQRAFFNHTLFPVILGGLFWLMVGFFSFSAIGMWALKWLGLAEVDEIPNTLFWTRVLFVVFFLSVPVLLFLFRSWRLNVIQWIPGTEKIYRSARGAWASHMLAAQLDAGVDASEALQNTEKSLGVSLGQRRRTDPLLRQVLEMEDAPVTEYRRVHEILLRRLQNSRAHRMAWIPPFALWMVIAYLFSLMTVNIVLKHLFFY